MNFQQQLLFFFSALGAFNGIFLSLYFAARVKNRSRATYFLAALIFVISVRVGKSVFLIYYPQTSNLFIQIGLTACLLIGPFLYLYSKEVLSPVTEHKQRWLLHIVPIIIIMIVLGYFYPYRAFRYLWSRSVDGVFGWFLTLQWSTYILLSIYNSRHLFRKLLTRAQKLDNQEFWLLNVVVGTTMIWLAYSTTNYTSYIVGALSFSFTIYLSLLIWVFKRSALSSIFDAPAKYANKRIEDSEAEEMHAQLDRLLWQEEWYKNANLRLAGVANELRVQPHYLSQFLNDNCGKSFSQFVNEYRIRAAKGTFDDKARVYYGSNRL